MASTAAGVVDLMEGNTVLATGTLVNGAIDLTPAAVLAIGPHTLHLYYHGNTFVDPVTSADTTLTINKFASGITLTTSSSSVFEGHAFTLTAAVTGQVALAGSVTFFQGDTPLATKSLSANG